MRICRFFSVGAFRLQKLGGIDRHARENGSLMLVHDGPGLERKPLPLGALIGEPWGSGNSPWIAGQPVLLNCGCRESEHISLLMPVQRQVFEPRQPLDGEINRLPASRDGLDNVRSQECQGKQTADHVGGKTPFEGDVIDA